jgi:hypothetical protein
MKVSAYGTMSEVFIGIVLMLGIFLAFLQNSLVTWVVAAVLSVLFLAIGFFIPVNQPDKLFFRYCIGQAAVITSWFSNPFIGILLQGLILVNFLIRIDCFSAFQARILFIMTCIVIGISAIFTSQINHTFLPGLAVLCGTAIAYLYFLIIDFRITYLASGDNP